MIVSFLFKVSVTPSDPIQGSIRYNQVINCTVNTVKSSSAMIGWMRDNLTRVTIRPTISSSNTSLQFIYLMQGGVDLYICNVTILDTTDSQSAEIQSITST